MRARHIEDVCSLLSRRLRMQREHGDAITGGVGRPGADRRFLLGLLVGRVFRRAGCEVPAGRKYRGNTVVPGSGKAIATVAREEAWNPY